MGAPQHLSSLSCELRIIKAKNIDSIKSNAHLFVRCYLSAGNNKRVRLESKEISPKSLVWNESFSLECLGTQASMDKVMQGSVVFELRYRITVPVLGRIKGSHLLGSVEIQWKTVCESPEMEFEKWVVMVSSKSHGDVKPPALEVGMKVRVPAVNEAVPRRRRRERRVVDWDECGCMDGGCSNCADFEMLALAAAMEAF
ncbi:hypothetical protein ACSBR2_009082 [Camellia fascicularis]